MKPRSYGPFPYSAIIDRPRLEWPGGAHVALWIIPNIEYFSMLEKPGGYGAGEGSGSGSGAGRLGPGAWIPAVYRRHATS